MEFRKLAIRLKEDLSPPHFFQPVVYLLFLPVFTITSVLANADISSTYELFRWLGANIMALLICWAMMAFANYCLQKKLPGPSIFIMLLVASAVGATKGFLTSLCAYTLGSGSAMVSAPSRTVQAAILGLITIPTLSLFSATRFRLDELRSTLVMQRLGAEQGTEFHGQQSDLGMVSMLKDQLQSAKAKLDTRSPIEIPDLLRDLIRNAVKPMAQRLWAEESAKQQDLSLNRLLRVAILVSPFRAVPVALILGVGSYISFINLAGGVVGFARSILLSAMCLLGYLVAAQFRPRSLMNASFYFFFVNALIAAGYVLASERLFGSLTGYPVVLGFLTIFIWISQTGFMVSFASGFLRTSLELKSQIELHSEKLGVDSRVLAESKLLANRELANHLHSDVQNRLLALALRLEQGQEVSAREELDAIILLLDKEATKDKTSPRESLEEIARQWRGIAAVTLKIEDDALALLQDVDIVQVVREAVNNSIRHGMAQNICVTLNKSTGSLVLSVSDDGLGPRNGKRGLGSRFFDSIASEWRIEPLERGGSVLMVHF